MSEGTHLSGSSDKSPRKYTNYEDWCLTNAHLCGFLDTLTLQARVSAEKFKAKRDGTHSRCKEALLAHLKTIDSQMNDYQNQIVSLSQAPFPANPFLHYDDPKQIMTARKYIFTFRKIRVQQIEIFSQMYGYLSDVRNSVRAMCSLFTGNAIPKGKIFRLRESFFNLSFPDSISKLNTHLRYLQAYEKRLQTQISQFTEPIWKKDFDSYFMDLINLGKQRLDQELSYFRELEEEVSFSKALFNPSSIYQNTIDDLLKSNLKITDTGEFISQILDFCDEMMPKVGLDNDQQTSCILLLVRAVYNRFYERYGKMFSPDFNHDYQKVEDLKSIPATLFTIPTELVQTPITGTIGNFFGTDPFFHAPGQFLSQAIFQSNPIDALYCIHKCLIGIQKGALIHRLGGVDAKIEDVRALLCFDDLFSLFFGTLMASDIPDIYFVADFISRFAPKNSLSPAFEYATANIEALIEHVKRIDLDDLKEKAKTENQ